MRDNFFVILSASRGKFHLSDSSLEGSIEPIISLVDDITNRKLAKQGLPATSTAILGPFWRADTPIRENGSTITFDTPDNATVVYLFGKITCAETGRPIPNATVETWQASTNGQSW